MLQLATYSIYISTIKNILPTLIGKYRKNIYICTANIKQTFYESDTYIRKAASL